MANPDLPITPNQPSLDEQLNQLSPRLGLLFVGALWVLLVILTARFVLSYDQTDSRHADQTTSINESIIQSIQARLLESSH